MKCRNFLVKVLNRKIMETRGKRRRRMVTYEKRLHTADAVQEMLEPATSADKHLSGSLKERGN